MNHDIAGGEVNGPRLRGRIRAAGGDWLTLRPDGVLLLDVRTTLETEDGALVAVSFTGLSDLAKVRSESFNGVKRQRRFPTAPRRGSRRPIRPTGG